MHTYIHTYIPGPAKVVGCVAVGDQVVSIDGRDIRGRTLGHVYRELQAPCAAGCDPDLLLLGFLRSRGGYHQHFWVTLPRPSVRLVCVCWCVFLCVCVCMEVSMSVEHID
jgi:hypothetical protein